MESADLQLHHHHHRHQQHLDHQISHQVVAGSSSSTLPSTTRPCYTNSTLSTVGNDHHHASLPPPNHNNLLLNNLRCQQENGSHHRYPPPNNSNNSFTTGSDHHHHHQAVGINWPSSNTHNNININNSSWESCFISTSNPSSPYQHHHQYVTNTRHHHHQDHLLDTCSPSSPPFQKFNDLLSPPPSSCGGGASPQDLNNSNNEDDGGNEEEEAEQQRRQQLSTDLSEKLLLKTLMMTRSSTYHHHNQLNGGGFFRSGGPVLQLPPNNDNYGAENTMPSFIIPPSCNINNNNKSWNLSHINILPSVNISSLTGNNNSNGHIIPNNSGKSVEMLSNNNNNNNNTNSQAPLGLFPMAPRILNSRSGTTTAAGSNTAVLGRYSHLSDYNTSLIAPFDKDSSSTLSQSEIDHQHMKHQVSTQKKMLNNDNCNNVSSFKNSNHGVPASTNNKRASSCNPPDPKATQNAPKRTRPTSCPPFKVRKEKLGDRIAALQQLVAPFGKTDTASVLMEAIGYIKFLQSQVETLSVPYMKLSRRKSNDTRRGVPGAETGDGESSRPNLRSRGLCLVPASCMSYINNITTTTTAPTAAATAGGDPHGGVGGCNIWPPLNFNPNVTTYHM